MSVVFSLYKSAKKFLSAPLAIEQGINSQSKNHEITMNRTRKQTADASEDPRECITQNIAPNGLKSSDTKTKRGRTNQDSRDSTEWPTSKKRKTPLESQTIVKEKQCLKTQPVVEILVRDNELSSHQSSIKSTVFLNQEKIDEDRRSSKEFTPKHTSPNTGTTSDESKPDAKVQHYKFGSEEPETYIPLEKSNMNRQSAEIDGEDRDLEEVEDDEDEDDAPDAITIQESEQAARLKLKNAAVAIEAQRLKSRQKRKEREEEKNMRSLEEKQTKYKAEKSISHSKIGIEKPEPKSPFANMIDLETEPAKLSFNHQDALPELLPMEYLEDDDSDDSPRPSVSSRQPKPNRPKRIKFDNLVEKPPKDYHVGSTTYRVLQPSCQELAPKAAFGARRTKETWLQGRTGKKQGSNRQQFSKSFVKHQIL
ncbi:hypothetical protein K3495_g4933 [Podosphaera aphanis]|nr:hypothetical protein K3495_g4933 [Podosphaera aphanis]